ncbi:unnamed protein product [Brachionus calyciflorus]|uniref:Nuclear receptor domain-containing protein n=1 Tax=Brachionus calyciflorus TaxID=104777 RepID=A0A813TYP2_9BILA|nr:unnamed protein product [Brachionus calyciflorus]
MAKKIFKYKIDSEIQEQKTFDQVSNKTEASNEEDVKFYGDCKVCNDKATGMHYGISSCEACRTFFKRAIINHKKYHCRHKNCTIDKRQNNVTKCKYCRWKTCLNMGMSLNIGKIACMRNSINKATSSLRSNAHNLKSKDTIELNHKNNEQKESESSDNINIQKLDENHGSFDSVNCKSKDFFHAYYKEFQSQKKE